MRYGSNFYFTSVCLLWVFYSSNRNREMEILEVLFFSFSFSFSPLLLFVLNQVLQIFFSFGDAMMIMIP